MNVTAAIIAVQAGRRVRRLDWNASFLEQRIDEETKKPFVAWVQPEHLTTVPPEKEGAEPVKKVLPEHVEPYVPELNDLTAEWWVLP